MAVKVDSKKNVKKRKSKKGKIGKKIAGSIVSVEIYSLLVVLVIISCIRGYRIGLKIFSEEGGQPSPGADVVIEVTSGDSTADVADKLLEKDVISDKFVFKIQTILYEGKFKAGSYTVNTSSSPEDVIAILSGEVEETEES